MGGFSSLTDAAKDVATARKLKRAGQIAGDAALAVGGAAAVGVAGKALVESAIDVWGNDEDETEEDGE